LITYSLEIYPTPIRALGHGINAFCSRIGSIILPVLIEIISEYVTFIFVGMNLLCLFLMFFMPETIGTILKEEIEEETKFVDTE